MAWLTSAIVQRHLSAQAVMDMTDDTGSPDAVDADVIAQAIASATGRIKASLIGRYPTECAAQTASDLVTGLGCDLVLHYLSPRRQRQIPQALERYREAVNQLRDLSEGTLLVPEWTEPTQVSTAKIELQRAEDVVAGWEDEEKFELGTEHDEDVR